MAKQIHPGSLFILVSLLFHACSWSQEKPCPAVEVEYPAGNYIVPGSLSQIPYRDIGSRKLYLDAYSHPDGEIRPGVIVVHGGGWVSGNRISFIGQWLEMLTLAGFNWFSVDYRLSPEATYRESVEDLAAAVEFIHCNAQSFGIDPNRLAIMAEDSGAHLTSLLISREEPRLQAAVLFGTPVHLEELSFFQTERGVSAVFGPEASQVAGDALPINQTRNVPPVLAVHGTADGEVPAHHSQDYCDALKKAGSSCELLLVEGAGHRPENWWPEHWHYKDRVLSWLAEKLKLEPDARGEIVSTSNLQKNIAYGSYQDRTGAQVPLLLDAFVPDTEAPVPAVILVHGGGWEAGDKVTYITPLFRPLSEAGFAWFSINYRLTPEFRNSDQLDDVRQAIRFLRHHHERFNIDPDRIAIIGESAGGQLVTAVAAEPCPPDPENPDPLSQTPCDVQAVVSFYGVYDFEPMVSDASPKSLLTRLFGGRILDEAARRMLRRHSPIHLANPEMPPTLLIHGTNEQLWKQGIDMRRRLQELRVQVELYPLEAAPHGMENWEGQERWQHYKEKLIHWLTVQLG
ncbi:MAG TPA: alpha/beta hydrolase [Acidobacteriota bacterium]|nr:alpha/beta hydrolase [Acidobacteriota bacterium]